MKKDLRLILASVGGVLLLVLLLQNSASVALRFIAWQVNLPLFLLILLSVLAGMGLAWLLKFRR